MKKMLMIALATSILGACTDNVDEEGAINQEEPSETEPSEPEPADEGNEEDLADELEDSGVSQNVVDYFPIVEDRLLSYTEDGGDTSVHWYPQFIDGDQVQYHINGVNTQMTTVYSVTGDQIEETFKRENTTFRDNFIETGIQGNEEGLNILLQAPIEVGHSWDNPSGETSEITAIDAVITTEAGEEHEAIEVVRTNDAGEEVIQYFAEGVGLIQTDAEEGATLTLTSIEEGVPEPDHVLPVYTYQIADGDQIEDDVLIRHEVEVELYTNDPIRLAMMDVLSQEDDEMVGGRPTMEEGEINFMYMTDEGIPHVDFSDPITQDYVGGSSSEHLHNALLIDMVADYYGTNEIIFTVEEEEWFGSHLQFDDIHVEAWQYEYMSEEEFIEEYGENYTTN